MTDSPLTASSLQPEVWTSSSNECLKIFVTDPDGAIQFQPEFTYPIFGDSETIFGFKDLTIFLCFDHYTFYPFLNIKYSQKLDDGEIEDPKDKLLSVLPESTIFKDEEKWVDLIEKEKETYNIPGEKFSTVEHNGETYSVYKISLKDAKGLELHKRLQILVLLFIEAGSYIDASDPLWDLYVLYKVDGPNPSIVGFSTVYNYWKYPGSEKFDKGEVETRMKISQFVILPIHQSKGLGKLFYSSLYENWLADDKVFEIVVEDPNEGFDDLRDKSDLSTLKDHININDVKASTAPGWFSKTRRDLKLEQRQFSRLVEMVLLYKLKNQISPDTKAAVRLFIKKRIYEKNKDGLNGLDENTKKDKLQTAYQSLEEDYYRILGDFKFPSKRVNLDTSDPNGKRVQR